jgi:hypothetical protein
MKPVSALSQQLNDMTGQVGIIHTVNHIAKAPTQDTIAFLSPNSLIAEKQKTLYDVKSKFTVIHQ